ncbi:ATPase, T2SS/T4P/T4SS family [Orrella marina]|uniref:Secretion protein n=1 Tax=Orrella marina TaxID=2163011 RepID=A0A2R4XI51_9BURK|nr:ATPase, T2SS/T4P/T4SS family [Orrella marina]AWB33468.1 secretion protein [Orrella marina]
MIEIYLDFEDGTSRIERIEPPCLIGRDSECHLRINHWRVGREHVRLTRLGEYLQLEDMGSLGGTRVNGTRVAQHFPLLPTDDVVFGPCRMRVQSGSLMAELDHDGFAHSGDYATCDAVSAVDKAAVDQSLRATLHAALVRQMDVRKHDLANLPDGMLRERCDAIVRDLIGQHAPELSESRREHLVGAVVSDAVGYGPLQSLLEDASVSEIMVNRHDRIFVESGGRVHLHTATFSSEAAVRSVIERIIYPIGRRIDDASPMVDARLPDGSRVNAVLTPISVAGSCVTIRKFPVNPMRLADLLDRGCISHSLARFLCRCIEQRVSLLISGGTGSGKTTLLNVLTSQVPDHERLITIEDAAELRIEHPHVLSLEARPSNAEGRGEINIRSLVRNALRMRPDRIIVGECRGAEALDMLSAMNTGHEGSMSTLHANTPRDAVSRLETMVLMASAQLPLLAIRELVSRSVQMIVQLSRLPDGSRMLVAVDEVTGMESGQIQMQPILRFHRGSRKFVWQGVVPSFVESWRECDVPVDPDWFGDQTEAA